MNPVCIPSIRRASLETGTEEEERGGAPSPPPRLPGLVSAPPALPSPSSHSIGETHDVAVLPELTPPVVVPRRRGNTLTDTVLLSSAAATVPSEVHEVRVVGCCLNRVHLRDPLAFGALRRLDAGENSLRTLANFAGLPCLQHLRLQCNSLTTRLDIPPNGFPQLEILDLSYNAVHPEHLSHLAVIPRLRVLDLTYNDLTWLPKDLSGFGCLEILILQGNRLRSSDDVFGALASIESLRLVDLSRNRLTAFPASEWSVLEDLNLGFNRIAHEDDLSGVESTPTLVRLVLEGNPIIIARAAQMEAFQELHPTVQIVLSTVPHKPRIGESLVQVARIQSARLMAPRPSGEEEKDSWEGSWEEEEEEEEEAKEAEEGEGEEEEEETHESSFFLTAVDPGRPLARDEASLGRSDVHTASDAWMDDAWALSTNEMLEELQVTVPPDIAAMDLPTAARILRYKLKHPGTYHHPRPRKPSRSRLPLPLHSERNFEVGQRHATSLLHLFRRLQGEGEE